MESDIPVVYLSVAVTIDYYCNSRALSFQQPPTLFKGATSRNNGRVIRGQKVKTEAIMYLQPPAELEVMNEDQKIGKKPKPPFNKDRDVNGVLVYYKVKEYQLEETIKG